MVLVMAVVVTAGGRDGRGGRSVVAVAGHGGRGGCGGRQVVAHGRVVRPGGHGRGGTEPVRGVRHLTASGQVAVSHGRVVHVRCRRGAGQTVKVGLVQVRVIHVGYGSGGAWQYTPIYSCYLVPLSLIGRYWHVVSDIVYYNIQTNNIYHGPRRVGVYTRILSYTR